jgi:hypothetical protein
VTATVYVPTASVLATGILAAPAVMVAVPVQLAEQGEPMVYPMLPPGVLTALPLYWPVTLTGMLPVVLAVTCTGCVVGPVNVLLALATTIVDALVFATALKLVSAAVEAA